MNREQMEATIDAYESLVRRAVDIVNAPGPPWGYVSVDDNFARLSFDGDDAVITSPQADSYYDSCTIETETTRFPAALLFMTEAELTAWRTQAKIEYEAQEKKNREIAKAQREAEELRTYKALKKKFASE
jgi:hypothetical protein